MGFYAWLTSHGNLLCLPPKVNEPTRILWLSASAEMNKRGSLLQMFFPLSPVPLSLMSTTQASGVCKLISRFFGVCIQLSYCIVFFFLFYFKVIQSHQFPNLPSTKLTALKTPLTFTKNAEKHANSTFRLTLLQVRNVIEQGVYHQQSMSLTNPD